MVGAKGVFTPFYLLADRPTPTIGIMANSKCPNCRCESCPCNCNHCDCCGHMDGVDRRIFVQAKKKYRSRA